ncbi:hypothetical protein OUZ56_022933 [Daphnia magna]|uniref:G-protein coupled receptors family 1 profile domain-containing protein n=1 Tax=Daphnia magna TaxID=35525 RepID=A0ABR0AXW5_9CRUS|nr:hypothetical protein OUZ56_022933 [Daphnia magna]
MNTTTTRYLADIVYTPDGNIYNPINLHNIHIITKIIGCSIGIPFNLTVAFIIARDPHHRKKPRNILQLAVTCSNVTCFLPPIVEFIYWAASHSESVCQVYVAIVTVPQGLVSGHSLLALLDAYIALAYPLLHRRMLTSRLSWFMIFVTSFLIAVLIKIDYIIQREALLCQMWLVHVQTIAIVLGVLFLSCILLNIAVYCETRKHLDTSRTLKLEGDTTRMSIHVDQRKSSRMQLEAAKSLVIGVTILCTAPFIGIIFASIYFGCRLQLGPLECGDFTQIEPYIEDVSMLPAIVNPFIVLIRNKHFRLAFQSRQLFHLSNVLPLTPKLAE